MMKTNLTVEMMNGHVTIQEAIAFAEGFRPEYPKTPEKPRLINQHTADDVKKYSKLLEVYEKEKLEFDQKLNHYREVSAEIDSIIKEWIKKDVGVEKVPEKSRDKVWRKAWEDGHSSGYVQVYYHLQELVDLFE